MITLEKSLKATAKSIVANTAIEDRQFLDEWFEYEGQDVNVVGSHYSVHAPVEGALVVVYPCTIPATGTGFPEPDCTYIEYGGLYE